MSETDLKRNVNKNLGSGDLENLLGGIMTTETPEGDAVAIPAPPPTNNNSTPVVNNPTEPQVVVGGEQQPQELNQSFSNESFPIELDDVPATRTDVTEEVTLEITDEVTPEVTDENLDVGELDTEKLLEETFKKTTKKDSIKDLRKLVQTAKQENETLQQQHQELNDQLEMYKKGESLPESVKQRMDELEQKVNVFDFKNSPEYRKKIIEPIEELKTRARSLATEYEVNPSVFDEAISIDNRKERNAFLKDNFDDLGALEAHEIISNLKELDAKAIEAETEPKARLEAMKAEIQQEETLSQDERIKSIITSARPGWSDALSEVRNQETYPELTIIPNNEQHNQVVRQILEEARTEFTKTLQVMAASGVKELPPEVSKALAKRFVLSQASAVIAASREQYYKKNQEIVNNTKSMKKYNRPAVGTSSPGVKVDPATKEPYTPNRAAADALKNIGIE